MFYLFFLYVPEHFLKCRKRFVVLSLVKSFSSCVKRFKHWVKRSRGVFESGVHTHFGTVRSGNGRLPGYGGYGRSRPYSQIFVLGLFLFCERTFLNVPTGL